MRVGLVAGAFAVRGVAILPLLKFRLREWLSGAVTTLLEVAGLQVERVTAIDVAVDWITYVSSVDSRSEVVVQTKAVDAFTKTVEVVIFGESVNEFDELIFVDQMCALCVENYISRRLAGYGEPERWVITPIKCKIEALM